MDFTIRIAYGLKKLPQAREVRQKVFVEEQGFVNEFDDIDERAYHVCVFDGEQAVATGRLFEDKTGWHIGRVAVLSEYRGQMLGKKVMLALEQKSKELGIKEVSLSAQVRAKGFYEKLGYKSLDDLHYDEYCPHVTMKLTIDSDWE